MKKLIIIATIFLGFTLADAVCTNSYICDDYGRNCHYQDVCDSTIDLPSTNVPMPSLPNIDLKPLPSIQIPPLGTSHCEYMQVNGRWENVCW